ncbi:hypothetical protein HHK36_032851 [Tetracentron sinense]|uniref:Peptidase M3A/M3B catalytic domain-containing protein n=1 Tax=Tetracentron sinense TaxID=13715 RepID=A0A834Y8H0_TETSI|nr:hypothetical protein HHK36_032851 [Tetracentron sinense]
MSFFFPPYHQHEFPSHLPFGETRERERERERDGEREEREEATGFHGSRSSGRSSSQSPHHSNQRPEKEKKERFLISVSGITADLPGSNVRLNLSASEILKLADQIISKSKELHDTVASVPLDKIQHNHRYLPLNAVFAAIYKDLVTYMNVVSPLAELDAQQFPLVQSCVFPKMVSPSDDVRKASAEAERRIDAHVLMCSAEFKAPGISFVVRELRNIVISKREDVYRVIKAFAARGEWMSPEAKRYIQCLVRDFEQNGLNLTLSKREEVQRLRVQIEELSMRYIQNLNDDNTFLLFNETELFGLPPEFLKSLDKAENGKFKVTLRSHHVSPLLEFCKVGTTRRMVAVAYGQRCGEANLSVFEDLVHLRHKLARLLGYSNFADYAVESRMAKTSAKVFEFLEDISANLTDSAMSELTTLKDLKLQKKEEGESPFGIEDILYYVKRVDEQKFDLDFGAVKQYFPVSLVLSGVLKIFQDLFGLRFEEIENAEVWHSDVRLFSVLDFSSSELFGYFYLDLYSREGKYGHTCVMALQNGSLSFNGARQVTVL